MDERSLVIPESLAGQTLASALRRLAAGLSWTEARRLIASRRVRVNGALCLDDARRLKAGEVIGLSEESHARLLRPGELRIVYRDEQLVVIDKPAGLQTLRRREEVGWSEQRKARQPTVEELLLHQLAGRREAKPGRTYPVHRLDRDTSGLMLFALTGEAQQKLTRLFAHHEVERTYRAVALGRVVDCRIETWLVRDRGDGLRGSLPPGGQAEDADRAVTHVKALRHIADCCTLVECRLETGRTHQIRIHLAERGHPLCGEKIYNRPAPGAPPVPDPTGAPRQALHSAELRFIHPMTGREMRFASSWPRDLDAWLARINASEE